jgi:hypothetical protein
MESIGVEGVINIAQYLTDLIQGWVQGRAKEKQEKVERIFNTVVETSYSQLKAIHNDYITNLRILRSHLDEKTMPPRDLIRWLIAVGQQHRSDREALRAIGGSIAAIRWELDPNDKNKGNNF